LGGRENAADKRAPPWYDRLAMSDRSAEYAVAGEASAEGIVREVLRLREIVAPAPPDLDAGDLLLILQSLVRPFGSGRRFLLREIRPGVYVA
jgi:hypothetical protein